MSGSAKRPAFVPAKRRAVDDAVINSPWFGPPRLNPRLLFPPPVHHVYGKGGRPWIMTFVGTDQSFVDRLFQSVIQSGSSYTAGAFPEILAMRDYAEPPRALLNGDGSAAYVRSQVELPNDELPVSGELEEDFATALGPTLYADAFPPSNDLRPSWLRKLYLPMHQHFHVVACQLDCTRPGPTRIDAKRVIEAGMIVRRFVVDPGATQPRWEDWIPSPHGDGIWAEIAHEDMTPLKGTSGIIDPALLSADVFGSNQGPIYHRLGVDTDPKVALGIATTKLSVFPGVYKGSPLGDVAKHTARWGFLPLPASDKERPRQDPSGDASAIANAFASASDALFDERIGPPHDQAICTNVRNASLPILKGLHDALPTRPSSSDLNSAMNVLTPLDTAANVADVIDKVGLDALLGFVRGATSGSLAVWNSAVTNTLTTPAKFRVATDPNQNPIQTIPDWAYNGGKVTQVGTVTWALSVAGLDHVWAVMNKAAPNGAALGTSFDPRLCLAALGWVRANRKAILDAFYAVAFKAFNMPTPTDSFTPDSTGAQDPLTLKVAIIAPKLSVGALGREVDAWLGRNTTEAREQEPVPWPQLVAGTNFPQACLDAHNQGTALEQAIAYLDALGAGMGGAYAEVMDGEALTLARDLETKKIGQPLLAQGLDLNAQPERGFMVFPDHDLAFPGPAPTSGSLAAVKTAVHNQYMSDATSAPDAVSTAGKAAREVVLPRYDANSLYAVWCYARVAGRDPCDAPQLVWSRRTEAFHLAEPMDLLGLKPVHFQLPDLPKLLRDIPRMPKARALPFAAVTTPQDSGVTTGNEPKDTARAWGIAWICSFGIPVFTICAWILFQIILSILLIIPGFAWLLLLKFCIPVPVPKRSS